MFKLGFVRSVAAAALMLFISIDLMLGLAIRMVMAALQTAAVWIDDNSDIDRTITLAWDAPENADMVSQYQIVSDTFEDTVVATVDVPTRSVSIDVSRRSFDSASSLSSTRRPTVVSSRLAPARCGSPA